MPTAGLRFALTERESLAGNRVLTIFDSPRRGYYLTVGYRQRQGKSVINQSRTQSSVRFNEDIGCNGAAN